MNCNILIIGSTGQLGSKLLNYLYSNKIFPHTITCYSNKKKLIRQKDKFDIKYAFSLSDTSEKNNFIKLLNLKKYSIIYFLDYGSYSLLYLDVILKNNKDCIIAIANKEMIVSGGQLLIQNIKDTNNQFIPLDSEHFSLYRSNPSNLETKHLYLTASGGPFYFNKKKNLDKVTHREVISHPKWKMGINNSIDSSNFVNKLLEIFELSIIYKIDISKIDFLISKEAFIHSLIEYSDNTISINCFENNMLIPLIKPINLFFKSYNQNLSTKKYLNYKNLKLEIFKDKRFKMYKYFKKIKKFTHNQQISFIILNNFAHIKYINGQLAYSRIIDFILKNIEPPQKNINFKNFHDILKYIDNLRSKYENY